MTHTLPAGSYEVELTRFQVLGETSKVEALRRQLTEPQATFAQGIQNPPPASFRVLREAPDSTFQPTLSRNGYMSVNYRFERLIVKSSMFRSFFRHFFSTQPSNLGSCGHAIQANAGKQTRTQ